jgi:beta-lactam-binding protein with PASTA domain
MLSNVNQTIATAALEAAGLQVEIVTEQFSDTVASGNVINFVPLTEPIGTGGKVELIVSKGPVPQVG